MTELKNNTINSLLEFYKLNSARVAIEINGSVLKKSDYDITKIQDDDKIEIIHFVGGGA